MSGPAKSRVAQALAALAFCVGVAAAWLPAAAQDWSGFYAGAAAGKRSSQVTWETTCVQAGFPGAQCPDSSGFFTDYLAANNPLGLNSSARAFSGFLGLQWQLGALVAGLEGDFTHAHAKRTINTIPGAEDPAIPLDQSPDHVRVDTRWDATVRARAGFLVLPSILAYATGGPTWMRVDASLHCGAEFPAGWCSAENVGRTESISRVMQGWTWGGGVEAMLASGVLLRAEYRQARFGAIEHTFLDGRLNNADALATRTSFDTRTVLIGLGYKF